MITLIAAIMHYLWTYTYIFQVNMNLEILTQIKTLRKISNILHGGRLQLEACDFAPKHPGPPQDGSGESQLRDRVLTLDPHVLEHCDQLDHSPHLPATAQHCKLQSSVSNKSSIEQLAPLDNHSRVRVL